MTTSMRIIDALQSRGPHSALVSYGNDGRMELSGHVLANWVIKSVNFMRDELMIEPGARIHIDLAPHWKRTVLHIAAWSIGARVTCGGVPNDDDAPMLPLVATSDPLSAWARLGEDVLVLEPVSLSLRYSGQLHDMQIDWVQAVRAHSDALNAALDTYSGPQPAPGFTVQPGARVLLEDIDGADAPLALAAWLAGASVLAPASRISDAARASEGLSGATGEVF